MLSIKKTEGRILKLLIVINNFNFKIIQVTFNKADSIHMNFRKIYSARPTLVIDFTSTTTLLKI